MNAAYISWEFSDVFLFFCQVGIFHSIPRSPFILLTVLTAIPHAAPFLSISKNFLRVIFGIFFAMDFLLFVLTTCSHVAMLAPAIAPVVAS